MFNIPGKDIVSLTDKASAQILKLMEKSNHQGLRIGVKKGGCAGMEYTMDYVDEIDSNDEIVEKNGARVMIAPMAQARPYLKRLTPSRSSKSFSDTFTVSFSFFTILVIAFLQIFASSRSKFLPPASRV